MVYDFYEKLIANQGLPNMIFENCQVPKTWQVFLYLLL